MSINKVPLPKKNMKHQTTKQNQHSILRNPKNRNWQNIAWRLNPDTFINKPLLIQNHAQLLTYYL